MPDRDFPVFLHPQSGEEYALARTEVKTAPGYKGLSSVYGPEVTLEQDLLRRDLTINALAMDESGCVIDVCEGQRDLQEGLLRHITTGLQRGSSAPAAYRPFCGQAGMLGISGSPWHPCFDEEDGDDCRAEDPCPLSASRKR